MGVNLDTLRPEPCVEGYSTPGGYSYRAVKPIALERVMSISTALQQRGFREQGVSLSGIGGVETGGDAAEFILLGADTVQVSKGKLAVYVLWLGGGWTLLVYLGVRSACDTRGEKLAAAHTIHLLLT
jgi:hypothetical protein